MPGTAAASGRGLGTIHLVFSLASIVGARTCGVNARHLGCASVLAAQHIQSGGDNGVGVDAVLPVRFGDRGRLPEFGDP